MTVTDEELDLSQLFDFSIECEWSRNNASHDAHFMLITNCCKYETMLCAEHLEVLKAEAQKIIARLGFLKCGYHYEGNNFRSFDEWTTARPIRG